MSNRANQHRLRLKGMPPHRKVRLLPSRNRHRNQHRSRQLENLRLQSRLQLKSHPLRSQPQQLSSQTVRRQPLPSNRWLRSLVNQRVNRLLSKPLSRPLSRTPNRPMNRLRLLPLRLQMLRLNLKLVCMSFA